MSTEPQEPRSSAPGRATTQVCLDVTCQLPIDHDGRCAHVDAAPVAQEPEPPAVEQKPPMPHSRACGVRRHEHGQDCHANCPTCRGRELTAAAYCVCGGYPHPLTGGTVEIGGVKHRTDGPCYRCTEYGEPLPLAAEPLTAPLAQKPPAPCRCACCTGDPHDRCHHASGCFCFDCTEGADHDPPAPGSAQEPADPPQGQQYLVALGHALVACPSCGAAVGTGHTVRHDAWHRGQS